MTKSGSLETQRTFVDSKDILFFGRDYPVWVIVLVLTLLAYGGPVAAIGLPFIWMLTARRGVGENSLAGLHYTRIVLPQNLVDGLLEPGVNLLGRNQPTFLFALLNRSVFSFGH
jgi:hypothetical protein